MDKDEITEVKGLSPGIYYEKSPNQYANESKGELDFSYWHVENPRNNVMLHARIGLNPKTYKLALMWGVSDSIVRGMRRFSSQKDAEEYIKKMFDTYKFHWMKPECVDR